MPYKYYLHSFGMPFRVRFDDDDLPDTAESFPDGEPRVDNLLCLDIMFSGEPFEVDETTFWRAVDLRRTSERSIEDAE